MSVDHNGWQICDVSLREGQQSRPSLFQNETHRVAYADIVLGANLVDTLEVYRPGARLANSSWERLAARWGSRVRVYCGVAHRISEIPEAAKSISLTLLNDFCADGVSEILRLASIRTDLSMRIGLECATRWSEPKLRDIASRLGSIEQVGCISICDSLGEMTPRDISVLIGCLNTMRPDQWLGGHFHDDLGLAVANSIALRDSQARLRLLDVTIGGIGERVGIASLESALALEHGVSWMVGYREVIAELRRLAGPEFQTFDKKPLSGGRYIAASHFTPDGELRHEYSHLY